MENQIRRPPSVWLTQIVLGLYGGIPLLLLPFGLALWAMQNVKDDASSILFPLLGRLLFLLVPFWALTKRWRRAQILGAGAILYLLISVVSGAHDLLIGIPDSDDPNDPFPKIAIGVILIVWFVLFALLIWRLLFGSAANAFFAKPDTIQ